MSPTLKDGDHILTESFGDLEGRLQRGDVVTCKFPNDEDIFVKRIEHIPGDTITYKGKNTVLGEGEYWMLGDNNLRSIDSRMLGPVTEIKNRIFFSFNIANLSFSCGNDFKRKESNH